MTTLLLLVIACPLADSLFSHGFFAEAATEYQRYLWQNSDSDILTHIKLGLSLAAAGETNAARIQLVPIMEGHQELNRAIRKAFAGFHAQRQEYELARRELLDLGLLLKDSVLVSELYTELAWLELLAENEAAAADYLNKAGRHDIAAAVTSSCPRKNCRPALAVLLSTFLPGSGEIYAGQPLVGIVSFLITGSSGLVSYLAAKSGDWVSASFVFSFLFLRFYSGCRHNAADFCLERQRILTRKHLNSIRQNYFLEPDWFAAAESLIGFKLPCSTRR